MIEPQEALPYIRHTAMCVLNGVRDNPPDDEACTCGLREFWLRAALVRTPETLDARTFLALREAAQDVVIQEGRYYERDGSGESAFVAVVPKSALLRLRAALAASSAPDPGRAFAKGWPEYYGEPVPVPDPGAGLRRWATALLDTGHEDYGGLVWVTKAELRSVLAPSAEPPETET